MTASATPSGAESLPLRRFHKPWRQEEGVGTDVVDSNGMMIADAWSKELAADIVLCCNRDEAVQSLINAALSVLRVGLADVEDAADIERQVEAALLALGVVGP